MRKTKTDKQNLQIIDSDQITKKIVEAVSVEIRELLKNVIGETQQSKRYTPNVQQGRSQISMDESIIPTSVDIEVEGANLETATTEKKIIDTDLRKSKSKLKGIFNNRNKKE